MLTFEVIIQFITQINNEQNASFALHTSDEEYEILRVALAVAVENVCKGQITNALSAEIDSDTMKLRIFLAMKALWRLAVDNQFFWTRLAPLGEGLNCIKLNKNLMNQFTELMIEKNKNYEDIIYKLMDKNCEAEKEKKSCAKKCYHKLWKLCLTNCSHEWLIEHVKSWFIIVHQKENDSVEWIMNDIVNHMSSNTACEFGIYLTKYITFYRDLDEDFPKQYLDFLRKDLGIDWNLLNSPKI